MFLIKLMFSFYPSQAGIQSFITASQKTRATPNSVMYVTASEGEDSDYNEYNNENEGGDYSDKNGPKDSFRPYGKDCKEVRWGLILL